MRRGVRPRGTYTRRLAGVRELVHMGPTDGGGCTTEGFVHQASRRGQGAVHRGPTDEEGCTTEGYVHQASRRGQGAGPQGTN